MKLIEIKKIEDCLDGSMIFEYRFDSGINEELMRLLGGEGQLNYFPEFSKPFFKIITAGGLQIKGIIRDRCFEVVYPQTDKWQIKKDFERSLLMYLEKTDCS